MATHIEPADEETGEATSAGPAHTPPILGYTKPAPLQVSTVNMNKALEEDLLARMDMLADHAELAVDKRWLAIARTNIEAGFMALNRAIMKPKRLSE